MINYFKVLDTAIRRAYVDFREYKKQSIENAETNIRFYNWSSNAYANWFHKFTKKRQIIAKGQCLNFCSVDGYRGALKHIEEGAVVFFPVENLHDDRMNYADHLMYNRDRIADLALGFDYFVEPYYMRFPLWPLYVFDPEASDEQIIKRCAELRFPNVSNKSRFASLVARFDWNGTRSQIYNAIAHVDKISCPSGVLHNDDTLVTEFQDNKAAYLNQFFFNICPENSDSYGYVTEKVFEAIASGCIPIYWGSYNNPEPTILNKDAIIFWDMHGDNTAVIKQIEELYTHPAILKEFIEQPRLLPNADEYILDMFHELESKLRMVINKAYK